MCAHCQRLLVHRQGSGGELATCGKCWTRDGKPGIICGDCAKVDNCRDWRRMIENIEAGRDEYFRLIYGIVPAGVPQE